MKTVSITIWADIVEDDPLPGEKPIPLAKLLSEARSRVALSLEGKSLCDGRARIRKTETLLRRG